MAKINITKPTGSEVLSLLSAFKTENLTYVVFDSEKVGSMGLPIIYISKLTEKLEKVMDDNEWQSVKNSLKGIINGTNFEYVKVADILNADEVFYTPLTLPQSSFDLIKSRYIVTSSDEGDSKALEQPTTFEVVNTDVPAVTETISTDISKQDEVIPTIAPTMPEVPEVTQMPTPEIVAPVATEEVKQPEVPTIEPVMPTVNAQSNANYVATPNVVPEQPQIPVVEPVPTSIPEVQPISQVIEPVNAVEENSEEAPVKFDTNIFVQDKETFLKACENMFDALVSKYQKQLDDLERREQNLKTKELEVENKLNDASEHLANAEAREQVANIAHDNAQRVMDINNLMPSNPNA